MRKMINTILATFIVLASINGQTTSDLYMPKEIKAAYKNGTRSYDGKPGENYFQNRTDYKIKAEFDPATRILKGEEVINFENNSTNELSNIFIQLYQDIFKKGGIRVRDYGPDDITDGVEIKSISINGKAIDLKSEKVRRYATLMMLALDEKIAAKSKNKIEIKWSLVIPGKVKERMGTYENTNFMVAYWYPKISVYDDIMSWNTIPYAGNLEFYSEYGDFDVELTVPSDFIVLSSGLLQNGKDIFSEKYQQLIDKAAKSDEVVHIIGKGDHAKKDITKKADKHTWKFKAEYLPDFAFTTFNTYLWDATSVKVEDKRVLVHAVYKENSNDFHKVAEISRKCIDYFSTKTPAIPFPYPQMVAFNGSGGMEFPGMVNDGDSRDLNGTLFLTSHEIGHTYFPFYVGTNEQKYAWIDEGLISFFPRKIIAEYTEDENYQLFSGLVENYNYSAGTAAEIPLIVSSENTGQAYGYHAYTRPSNAFYVLHEYLGEATFNRGLQEFTRRWNGKHPTPYDFFFTFNQVAGEDLAWFWKPWFFEMGYADLTLKEINEKPKATEIVVEKSGSFPVHIVLKTINKKGIEKVYKKSPGIWKNGEKTYRFEIPKDNYKEIVLDPTYMPDANDNDNIWTAPHEIDNEIMQSYVGKYGPRNILLENGKLFYQREGRQKMEMIALEDDYFRFTEIGYFRLRVVKEKGEVVALEGNYSSGHKDISERDNK